MKRTIIATLLLISFGMAEDASQTTDKSNQIPIQETKQKVLKNLQGLGRGYAKDPETNQIYYDGKWVEIFSPKTFTIINEENEDDYDAEDYYVYYKNGNVYPDKIKVALYAGPNHLDFDYVLNIPAKCFDDKDIPADLLKCYQRYIPFNIWLEGTPLNPDTFKVLGWLAKSGWVVVTDGQRLIGLRAGGIAEDRMFENFSINKIYDFSTFEYIGRQFDKTILAFRINNERTSHYDTEKNEWVYKTSFGEFIQWAESMELKLFYFKDKKYVYANQFGIIDGADPETFELLTFPYAKDKNHVFYNGQILQGANRDEFEILEHRLKITRDKTHIFYKNHILKETDVESFRLVASSNKKECPMALLMDKNSIYYVDELLSDEPEYPISLSTKYMGKDEKKYQPDRLYGMVSLPFFLDNTNVEIVRERSGSCRSRSSMGVKSHDSLFFIGRIKDTLYTWDMIEEDLLGIAPP